MEEADKGKEPEFKWGKKRGVGGKSKKVQFYQSFTYDGVDYVLYDSVYLYKEGEPEPYIGKLIKIWETPDKSKRVKVLWYFRPREILHYLGGIEVRENELFLACGEGLGLSNINPLEVIVGKCNVICISNDSRNPQPLEEELQSAEFVYHRFFDVGQRKILDKIDDKIAEVEVARDKTKYQVKVEENGVSKASLVKQKSSSKLSHDFRVRTEMGEVARVDDRRGEFSSQKTPLRSKDDLGQGENKVVKGNDVELSKGLVEDMTSQKEKCEVSKKKMMNNVSNQRHICNDVDIKATTLSSSREKYKLHRAKDRSDVEGGPSPKEKREVSKKKIMINVSNQRHVSNDVDIKATPQSSLKEKNKLHRAKDRSDVEDGPSKKLKIDKKPLKLSSDKLHKESSMVSPVVEKKLKIHASEVTRRLDVDRSKWFKGIPWDEKMRIAYERGTLVLLQNLDPCLTSEQVQEIIWHGFEESCTAHMIQKTAFTSPHSGQAFVIFKRKETAEMVVRKLEEDCLLMSNGRPLVGSMGRPCFREKKPIFYGHHVLDQLRIQRDMKEAVSTSHCSQPNTIEYDMSMEWCLQQQRADKSWRRLYQRQGEEMRKLKAKLKTKI